MFGVLDHPRDMELNGFANDATTVIDKSICLLNTGQILSL